MSISVYPLLRKLILLISTSFLCLCRAFIHQSAVIMHLPANIGKPHLNFSYQRFCCMKMDLLLYTVTIKRPLEKWQKTNIFCMIIEEMAL